MLHRSYEYLGVNGVENTKFALMLSVLPAIPSDTGCAVLSSHPRRSFAALAVQTACTSIWQDKM